MGKNINLSEFGGAIDEILSEFVKTERAARQEALSAGSDVMAKRLESASPNGEKGFARNWKVKKYNDLQAVHNTTTVDGGGKKNIPLANILEHKQGSKHYGFIRRTEQAAENEVFNAIKKKLEDQNNE